MKNTVMKILSILIIICSIFSFGTVYAKSQTENNISAIEYTEDYKEWLKLTDEEKEGRLEPRKYDIITGRNNSSYLKDMDNIFKMQQLLRANVSASYNLQDIIPENVKVRNQMQTNSCWAFATIGVLESHLALRDKNASSATTVYDFSEKHMNYATAKAAFLNNEINPYGFAKEVSEGGNFYLATQYLANGLGAVDENEVPFVNSEEDIDISEIQNKEVKTTLYDTVEFPNLTAAERDQVMPSMKEHIVNYGGLYAGLHGATLFTGDSYNNETGSIFCNNVISEPIDHAAVIIGWDDNYSKENFNAEQQPSENGAWIIKNSWGENMTEKLSLLKEALFEAQQSTCEANGWYSPEEIPTDVILDIYKASYGEDKVTVQGEDLVVEIGNKGYMYISYEDCNIYKSLIGIEKATNTKDFENVYQNDILGPINNIGVSGDVDVNLANVFTRDASVEEALDKISVYTFQGYTCKVLVNPNGDSKAKEDLQEVKLKAGETETFEAGYHTIEFAEPIKLTGDKFVVVLQVTNDNYTKEIALESKIADTMWKDAIVNPGESFCAIETEFENNVWTDLATMENESLRGNLCIKAYTTSEEVTEEATLTDIYVETQPTKTAYTEGENFDKSGMKVMARYSDGSTKEITNYTIVGGENLTTDATSVTIQYTENGITKTTTQAITVKAKGEPTDPEKPSDDPVPSDFSNAKSVITESKIYFNSKDLTQSSSEITIKISDIKMGNETNTYKYYYHISGTQGDENITDWKETEIEKENDGTYSITLHIQSDIVNNYAEVTESDNLYVYIREVAQVDGNEVENIVTLQTENQSEPECYIDGNYVGGIEDVLNYNNGNHNNSTNNGNEGQKEDNTVASGILPYAGSVAFKVIVILAIIAFAGFAYYRYKNIDR